MGRTRWRWETLAAELPDQPAAPALTWPTGTPPVTRSAGPATPPRQQRAVLVLRYFEDLPEADVARLLGCSPGTVKTHTHRGLRALRTALGPDLNPASTRRSTAL